MKKIIASILATGLLVGSAAAMADEHDWHHGAYAEHYDHGLHRGWEHGRHYGWRNGYTYFYEAPAYSYTYVTPYYYYHHHRYYRHDYDRYRHYYRHHHHYRHYYRHDYD